MHFNIHCFFLLIFLVIVESTPTHYETLNVPFNASTEKIKANYRELMMKYHPDKNKNNPKAKEIAQRLNGAYKILTDEQERTKYDKGLHTSSGSSHTTSGGSSTTSAGSSATNRGATTTSARPSATHARPAATPEKSSTTSKRSSATSSGSSTASGRSSKTTAGGTSSVGTQGRLSNILFFNHLYILVNIKQNYKLRYVVTVKPVSA